MRKNFTVVLIILCMFFVEVIEANAGEDSSDSSQKMEQWYIGPQIGFSPFTGVLGLEIQYRYIAVSLGAPGNFGLKHYFSFPKHSWFIGGFLSQYDFDKDETKDGITYTECSNFEGGISGGYRWRWGSGWDLSLSLGIAYGKEELRNNYYIRTENYIGFRPGVTIGYSF